MSPNRHVIFGTAGHVDHGKSALVLALTGTDPDRLTEEKTREMTIDLGFAFLTAPGFEGELAIVDVPGHEMFIRNMVAGATGIDAAILVVDADEGVKPQTVEHLDVLRFLNVGTGIVALTKIDKVSDERVNHAKEEVTRLVAGTFLQNAPILRVSAKTGEGLDALRAELGRIASDVIAKSPEGIFRLPVDRVFTLKGIGTVITGSVVSGTLDVGDTVCCLPGGVQVRARNLHVHDQPVERIVAGQRAAVNLTDISKTDLHRGDVLTTPGTLEPTMMADVRLTLSSRAPKPIKQRTRVRIHHGTKEVMARVVVLEGNTIRSGESKLAQLRLESPLVAASGDLLVIRSYSPMFVIGGGRVVDPHPPKRKHTAGSEELAQREHSSRDELVLTELERASSAGLKFSDLCIKTSQKPDALGTLLATLQQQNLALEGRKQTWYAASVVADMQEVILISVNKLHSKRPLNTYIPLNALVASVLKGTEHRGCFTLALDELKASGSVLTEGQRLKITNHSPNWNGAAGEIRLKILDLFLNAGLATPNPNDLAASLGINQKTCQDIVDALLDSGELCQLSQNILIHTDVFAKLTESVRSFIASHGSLTISQARELFGASRKYLLPFLETLDEQGITERQADARVLRDTDQ